MQTVEARPGPLAGTPGKRSRARAGPLQLAVGLLLSCLASAQGQPLE